MVPHMKPKRKICQFTAYQDFVTLDNDNKTIAFWRTWTTLGASLSKLGKYKRGDVVPGSLILYPMLVWIGETWSGTYVWKSGKKDMEAKTL